MSNIKYRIPAKEFKFMFIDKKRSLTFDKKNFRQFEIPIKSVSQTFNFNQMEKN